MGLVGTRPIVYSSESEKEEAKAILRQMFEHMVLGCHDPRKPGDITRRLSEEDREKLKCLTAEDIMEVGEMDMHMTYRGTWGTAHRKSVYKVKP